MGIKNLMMRLKSLLAIILLSINVHFAWSTDLLDGVKICKKNPIDTCLGLNKEGRAVFKPQATNDDPTIHWRFKEKPGVKPDNPNKERGWRSIYNKGYIENLSNCKMLDVEKKKSEGVIINDKNAQNDRQVWTLEEVERENWYDELFFRLKNEYKDDKRVSDATEMKDVDYPMVLDASDKKHATVRALDKTNEDQQLVLEESLDILSNCGKLPVRIVPFSGN